MYSILLMLIVDCRCLLLVFAGVRASLLVLAVGYNVDLSDIAVLDV